MEALSDNFDRCVGLIKQSSRKFYGGIGDFEIDGLIVNEEEKKAIEIGFEKLHFKENCGNFQKNKIKVVRIPSP